MNTLYYLFRRKGAAVADDGSMQCGALEVLPDNSALYLLVADFRGYDCSGQLVAPDLATRYDFLGTQSCMGNLAPGRYDSDRDGDYELSDFIDYLHWSLLHRKYGYTVPLYPLDATE